MNIVRTALILMLIGAAMVIFEIVMHGTVEPLKKSLGWGPK